MNIIIPMAGLGTRFTDSGFKEPKPLIKIGNTPMYRYAVNCLPLHLATQLIFIVRKDEFAEAISEDINNNYGQLKNCHTVFLEYPTRGQAETVLYAGELLDREEPTLVHNCDTYFKGNFTWSCLLQEQLDGAMVLFTSQEERWSYALVDASSTRIIDVQEKKVISSHASTGTYFFKDSQLLLDNIRYLIKEDIRENNEYYLSTIYKLMLHAQMNIMPLWTKNMLCFGTPADLVQSLNYMLQF